MPVFQSNPIAAPEYSRRRFVQGLPAEGNVVGLILHSLPAWGERGGTALVTLRGTEFNLSIGGTPVISTGLGRRALMVAGSLTAPLLRGREGDRVTLRVSARTRDED